MSWEAYRVAGKLIAGGARTGNRIGGQLADRAALHVAGRGARRGLLAPNDPTPPPTAPTDYWDYRGVATWKEARNLAEGAFPLGSVVELGRGRLRGPIGIPEELMGRHAVVVGPSGTGKTKGLLIPWIHAGLACGWSVVAVDVKGDLLDQFFGYKQEVGGALGAGLTKWDFTDPRGSRPWEWITEMTTDGRVDAAVTALLGRRPEQTTADPFYYQRDYRTLRGLLLFSAAVLPRVRTVSDLLRTLEDDQRLETLVRQHPRAAGARDLDSALSYPQADYPKVISGVVTALSVLDTANVSAVMRSSSVRPSMSLESMLDEHHLLVLGAPLKGGETSSALSGLMLNQLRQRLFERFSGRRRPVLLVVDEMPQIMGRVDIPQLLEVARSAGVGVVLGTQDTEQVKDPNERSTILSNAATVALMPGASPASVGEFGRRLGQRYEQSYGLSNDGVRGMRAPRQTLGTEAVPVLRERELLEQPFAQRAAIVHIKAPALGITGKPIPVELFRAAAV